MDACSTCHHPHAKLKKFLVEENLKIIYKREKLVCQVYTIYSVVTAK